MPSLRLGTWNIAGARRERTDQVNLDAVVAGVRALNVDLLAVQEVDRDLARSCRVDQPAVMTAGRVAPRLLVGDLNMPSTVLLLASRRGWPETGRGPTFPNSAPTQQLDHILRNDPAGVVRPRGVRVAAAPVSDHRALVVELDIAAS